MADPVEHKWCSTKMKVSVFKYTWTIKDATESVESLDDEITSECFSGAGYNWKLTLLPNQQFLGLKLSYTASEERAAVTTSGFNRGLAFNQSVRIQTGSIENSPKLSIAAWILDADNQRTNHIAKRRLYSSSSDNKLFTFENFVKRESLLDDRYRLIDDADELTIVCKIKVSIGTDEIFIGDHSKQPQPPVQPCRPASCNRVCSAM